MGTSDRQIGIVCNPAAGGGRCGQRIGRYADALRAAGDVRLYRTRGPGHARDLVATALSEGCTDVVAAGGDGTLFEVVNGLLAISASMRLGVLPLGTGNSFVRDFDLHDPDAALAAVLSGRTQPVDVLRLTHAEGVVYSINLISVGFSARAGAMTNARFKPLGSAGYVLAVLASLVRMVTPTYAVGLDGATPTPQACTLLSFCNSRYTAGDMMMAPLANPADGELDVVRIDPLGRRAFLRAFPRIFKGTHGELDTIHFDRAREVDFDMSSPVHVMIDGEVLRIELRRIDVVPAAVELLA